MGLGWWSDVCDMRSVGDESSLMTDNWLVKSESYFGSTAVLGPLNKNTYSDWFLGFSYSTSSYTVTKPKLDLPTKFHPNQTKIANVCVWGGF